MLSYDSRLVIRILCAAGTQIQCSGHVTFNTFEQLWRSPKRNHPFSSGASSMNFRLTNKPMNWYHMNARFIAAAASAKKTFPVIVLASTGCNTSSALVAVYRSHSEHHLPASESRHSFLPRRKREESSHPHTPCRLSERPHRSLPPHFGQFGQVVGEGARWWRCHTLPDFHPFR